jgi:hypothetical protein
MIITGSNRLTVLARGANTISAVVLLMATAPRQWPVSSRGSPTA